MLKYLYWILFMAVSVCAFEKGEEFFERGDYESAVKAFLLTTKENDPRVCSYLQYIQDKKLINPDVLGNDLLSGWQQRLKHAQYIPQSVTLASVYVQLSILAQNFYHLGELTHEQTIERIKKLSKNYQLGFGFFIIARYLENAQEIQKMKSGKFKKLVHMYEQGAHFSDTNCVLALQRKAISERTKVDKQYLNECRVLEQHRQTPGMGERILSHLYAGRNDMGNYGPWRIDHQRKTYWQMQGLRLGNIDLLISLYYLIGSKNNMLLTLREHFPFIQASNQESLFLCYFAAVGEHPLAQQIIGCCFMGIVDESPFQVNCHEALTYLTKVIESGRAKPEIQTKEFFYDALYAAGNILDKGTGGVPIDEPRALEYYLLAADLFEKPDAAFNAASLIDHGRGTKADPKKAAFYFERASKFGSGDASRVTAYGYAHGRPPYTRNLKMALAYWTRGDKQGNAECSWNLYLFFNRLFEDIQDEEYFLEKDPAAARAYLKKAVQGGHELAQDYWFHSVAESWESLPTDEAILFVKCLHNCSSKDAVARVMLALFYVEGYRDLITKDEAAALPLLQSAASENNELAISSLGCAFEHGLFGLEQSYPLAVEHYSKSLSQAVSLSNLAFLKERGLAGKRDVLEIIALYEKAISLKCGSAANNLGVLYQNGELIPENHTMACNYFKQGWQLGDQDAGLQYARYLFMGTYCPQNISLAREILSTLDQTDLKVQYASAAVQMTINPMEAWLKVYDCAYLGYPYAEYAAGLETYFRALSSSNSNAKIEDALKWLKLASGKGLQIADSAIRILQRKAAQNPELLKPVISSLLMGDADGARQALADARQKKEDESLSQPVDLSKDAYVIGLAQRDVGAAQRRQDEALEYFLDPVNRKSIRPQDLEKLVATSMMEKGGYAKSTKGSGKKIKVGSEVVGYHNIHRPGQSSRATLDLGRASSFQKFAAEVNKKH